MGEKPMTASEPTSAEQLDKLLEDTIQGLCRTFPITGVALVFSKVEEADDCPLISAGTLHGPLRATDDQTIRRLLIATTRFQEQLVIMLQHHQSRYSAYTAAGVEQQEQLLQRVTDRLRDCEREIEAKHQLYAVLEKQCDDLRRDNVAFMQQAGDANAQGNALPTGTAKTPFRDTH